MIRRIALRTSVAAAAVAVAVPLIAAAPATASTAAETRASGCVASVYRQGSSGTCVRYVQTLVNKFYSPIGVDGQFGPATKNQIIRFQKDFGLAADGIVGRNTWFYLCVPNDGGFDATASAAGCRSLYS